MGINWPQALWQVLTDFFGALTSPAFKISEVGALAATQVRASSQIQDQGNVSASANDPPLGKVFASNVFGHYVLSHDLTPLLRRAPDHGRLVLISSLEAYDSAFSVNDIQSIEAPLAYEASKRLTDILALTSTFPSTAPFVQRFYSTDSHPIPQDTAAEKIPGPSSTTKTSSLENAAATESPRLQPENGTHITLTDRTRPLAPSTTSPDASTLPTIYLVHPGVCATNIVPLPWALWLPFVATIYLARLLGSYWHCVTAYKGAAAPVWMTLSAKEELEDLEVSGGRGKWGSSCGVMGAERVRRTRVEGWGLGGEGTGEGEGGDGDEDRVMRGRREGRERFEELGRKCWMGMEGLREEWEKRLKGRAWGRVVDYN